MRFASFILDGTEHYGVVAGDAISVISAVPQNPCRTLAELVGLPDFVGLSAGWSKAAPCVSPGEITLLPPIPSPAKIFCVGLNYEDHRVETRHDRTVHPTLFTRFGDSHCAHDAPMLRPLCSDQFDYEAELAVVIGRPGRQIGRKEALEHVAGYACYNDGSIRDWQVHSSQFLPGKNFPRTGAFGPCLVTADEVPDPQDLSIVCRLNGETVQSACTSDMINSVASLISYISRFTPLSSGDVIATGTPGGVGFTRKPPLFMRAGDVVEVEIECVGLLRNHIEVEANAGNVTEAA
jgi:2-keto-4-pentenoate hydratase/2-oxohepta-3-ene-1,7-dioic acid hydratase in catechol pathway